MRTYTDKQNYIMTRAYRKRGHATPIAIVLTAKCKVLLKIALLELYRTGGRGQVPVQALWLKIVTLYISPSNGVACPLFL